MDGDPEICVHTGNDSVPEPLDPQESFTDTIDSFEISPREQNDPLLTTTVARKKKDTLEVLADAFAEHLEENKKRREEDKRMNTAMMNALTTAAEGINNLGKAAVILAEKFTKDD